MNIFISVLKECIKEVVQRDKLIKGHMSLKTEGLGDLKDQNLGNESHKPEQESYGFYYEGNKPHQSEQESYEFYEGNE